MAWDFSTEPEFESKLQWMRGFVREEVFPLETLDLSYDQVRLVVRPLQDRVKEEGLWAAHLPPSLGGMGFGQVKLGLMHEILASRHLRRWSSGTTLQIRETPSCWRSGSRPRATKSRGGNGCSHCSMEICARPSP